MAGRTAFADGDFPAAIALLRQAVRQAPDDLGPGPAPWRGAGRQRRSGGGTAGSGKRPPATPATPICSSISPISAWPPVTATARARRLPKPGSLQPASREVARAQARIYEALGEQTLAVAATQRMTATETSPAALTEAARLCLHARQFREAEAVFRRLQVVDADHFVFAQHGLIWCRLGRGDWRGALELAIGATRADRFDLTTELLAYARDRLFTRMPADEAAARESALAEQFMASLRQHAELHREDDGTAEEALHG